MAGGGLRSWKVKAAAQQVFSRLPGGERLNLLFQRHVTHGLPLGDAELASKLDAARRHLAAIAEHGSTPVADATTFEFGAGWDLALPLAFHRLGVARQVVVDVRPNAQLDLVVDADRRLASLLDAALPRSGPDTGLAALLAARGIDFQAPSDARATGLPAGSIDYVTSTSTLEHIPPDDIRAIYRECHRLLGPDGLMSSLIDYRDHYAYFDPSVSVYDFLQHPERRWRRYNPSLHHQNRLRHDDHVALATEAGFDVVAVDLDAPTEADRAALDALVLAEPWASMPRQAVAVPGAHLVLRPR